MKCTVESDGSDGGHKNRGFETGAEEALADADRRHGNWEKRKALTIDKGIQKRGAA